MSDNRGHAYHFGVYWFVAAVAFIAAMFLQDCAYPTTGERGGMRLWSLTPFLVLMVPLFSLASKVVGDPVWSVTKGALTFAFLLPFILWILSKIYGM